MNKQLLEDMASSQANFVDTSGINELKDLLRTAVCPHQDCRNGVRYHGSTRYGGDVAYSDCEWCVQRKKLLDKAA